MNSLYISLPLSLFVPLLLPPTSSTNNHKHRHAHIGLSFSVSFVYKLYQISMSSYKCSLHYLLYRFTRRNLHKIDEEISLTFPSIFLPITHTHTKISSLSMSFRLALCYSLFPCRVFGRDTHYYITTHA